MKSIPLAFAAVLAVTACSPATNTQNPNQRAETGAIIGGLVGGLVGASSSDDKLVKGVVGAGIGAAVGGAIGDRLDRQADALRQDLPNPDIAIENTGSELRVTLPQNLLFAVDSAAIPPSSQTDLRSLAANLNAYPNSDVIITGHTDDTGSAGYNYDLSERRARAVAAVLTNAGVEPSRLRSFGRGEDSPVASNATDAGRAQNRRVEIVIRPRA